MIRFEQVSYTYPGKRPVEVLRDVSFSLEAGETGVIRGGNGTGKSTLMRLAAGLLTPRAGKVTVAGRRLNLLRKGARAEMCRGAIAYLPQRPVLVSYLSALENVLLATLATPINAPEVRANQLLIDLGIGHRATHLPAALSAGERQRCAVARALLARPKVILADEPTAVLDPEGGHTILHMLAEASSEGATVLIATRAELATLRIDRAYSLSSGTLNGG